MKNIIIAILCLTNLGLLWFIFMYTKKTLLAFKAFSEFESKMAAALELYITNDTSGNILGKKVALDNVFTSFALASSYWRVIPAPINTLMRALNIWFVRYTPSHAKALVGKQSLQGKR